jgi:hypothetical protein
VGLKVFQQIYSNALSIRDPDSGSWLNLSRCERWHVDFGGSAKVARRARAPPRSRSYPPPRQRQSTGADESPSSFRYSARPARLSKAGRSNGRCREGRSDWRFILVAEQNAALAEQSRWSTSLPSGSLRMNGVDDIFRYDWGAYAPRVSCSAPSPNNI